jgi:hypothetical protein
MPFSIRPYRRFPVQCAMTCNAGPFQVQGTVRNLSWMGWRVPGDLPMQPGETLSLTVTLPTNNASKCRKPSSRGRGGRSLRWRILQSNRTLAPGSSITSSG